MYQQYSGEMKREILRPRKLKIFWFPARDILEGKGVLENSCVSAFEEFGQFIQEVN
jgi:hypothetical protein